MAEETLPNDSAASDDLPPPMNAPLPARIGPYHVLERLGEGGMGTVYKAEQRQPIRRMVAVKIIRLGFGSDEVVARFDAERRALSLMEHPSVARVLDAGVTDDARPYFVMEYVPGKPITKFADDNKLSIASRLQLFMQACDAITHAHTKAIIHRDIKSTNVLAYHQDGKPVVKVIDFGIAKALTGDRLTDHTFHTERGQTIGTYDSMSPEQADALPDIDTRTDVYSLGVLLYELLVGAKPFDRTTLATAGEQEIRRIIREVDPPRPSTRLTGQRELATRVARERRENPGALARALRAELEWIPLKAMRKERDRRYNSVAQLKEDVQRYLDGQPLLAGPESQIYRLKKLMKRRRGTLIATVAVLLALVAGIVGTSWQAVRATRAEHAIRAEQQRTLEQKQAAEEASANAQAINDFLVNDLLGAADPASARGNEVTVKDALDLAAGKVAEKFADHPAIEASIRSSIALTYDAIGRADLAVPHAHAAVEKSRQVYGEDHRETVGAMAVLVQVLQSRGQYAESERVARDMLQRSESSLGANAPLTLTSNTVLAHALHAQGKFIEAQTYYEKALALSRAVHGPDDTVTFGAMNNLASVFQSQGRFDDAVAIFRQVVEGNRRLLGSDHPDTLINTGNLAWALQAAGKLDEAEAVLRPALADSRRVLGNEHPNTLINIRNLGGIYQEMGRFDEAEKLYREALVSGRETLGEVHPDTLGARNNLASVLQSQGKTSDAEALYRQVLEELPARLGPNHPYVFGSMVNLGNVIARQGRYDEALPLFEEAYRRTKASPGTPAQFIVGAAAQYGLTLARLQRWNDAEKPLLEAMALFEEMGTPPSAPIAQIRAALADVYENTGRADQAKPWRDRAESAPAPASRPGD